ncbi:Spore germination protein GerE [Nocardioides dokdonensis FR1436]|uniref:Spore germination protein GerE n=1 Tax=Nocardioides dokdonensis FR1436 TaxID=1300347 RepID=A0A1A9GNL1_9ACTN|nr:helix-turn-helix transcriptional regulator [Nocardioides dokdonensis]ANH39242.1 Spore germination protein GerE [Nocardioides dokdonensis FR1436]
MATGLTAERVRHDVEVVARAGVDLDTFLEETVESVGRAVPWTSACLSTQDPSTRLLTSARKYGDLRDVNEHDREFALIEYGTVEPTAFSEIAAAEVPAAGVHLATEGDIEQSERMSRFMRPLFGFHDEARMVFRDGAQAWGAMALFRGSDAAPFAAAEIAFLASLSVPFARGVRTGMLARIVAAPATPGAEGPAVLVFGTDDQVVQMSQGAERRVADLGQGEAAGDPMTSIVALVGSARRYARGETSMPPRSRVRGASGMWMVLQAAPLTTFAPCSGDVVVTIEEARPPEIVALVVAAFGLTQRERDVTQLVLQGVATKEIATALHVSTYTVQDHLKSVFEKADVRSRRELVSRVYFDQYLPRMGAELGPSGWFSGAARRPARDQGR